MSENERVKLCPHCEGNVPLESDTCPYCGQAVATNEQDDLFAQRYQPPYEPNRNVKMRESEPDTNVSDPFAQHKEEFERNSNPQPQSTAPTLQKEEGKKQTLAILLLTLGAQALTIGLLILFFSTDGHLTLQWTARYWYFYCLLSLPLIFFGRKALTRSL